MKSAAVEIAWESRTPQALWTAEDDGPIFRPIDAALEIGAYEVLWADPKATFKTLAEPFAASPGPRPSEFLSRADARGAVLRVLARIRERTGRRFESGSTTNWTVHKPWRTGTLPYFQSVPRSL